MTFFNMRFFTNFRNQKKIDNFSNNDENFNNANNFTKNENIDTCFEIFFIHNTFSLFDDSNQIDSFTKNDDDVNDINDDFIFFFVDKIIIIKSFHFFRNRNFFWTSNLMNIFFFENIINVEFHHISWIASKWFHNFIRFVIDKF